MAFVQKELSGSLFKNDQKTTDSHPGMKGSCLINGVEYWVASWKKESPRKGAWLSLSFQRKEEKQERQAPQRRGSIADDPSDIPF